MGVILHHKASYNQITAIVNALRLEGAPPLKGGGIDALGWSTKENMEGTFHSIVYGQYLIYYPILIVLCSLAFIPLKRELNSLLKSRAIFAGLLLSAFVLIPVYIIANDWGRWSYIFIVEIFMAILARGEDVYHETVLPSKKWKKMRPIFFSFLIIVLLSYSSFWYLPHMLPDDSSWRSFVHNIPFVRH